MKLKLAVAVAVVFFVCVGSSSGGMSPYPGCFPMDPGLQCDSWCEPVWGLCATGDDNEWCHDGAGGACAGSDVEHACCAWRPSL